MFKWSFVVFSFFINTLAFSSAEFDRDIVVKDQSRNNKVKIVFREMMDAYEEEDLHGFFSYVSEDRFYQDYMTFYEAIEKDTRTYDILSIDTWVNKITDDGVKRFLYVQWEKRFETLDTDQEIIQKGYSRFLYDEINGKYKLVELAGNHFWGGSLQEWREEVPEIAGQVIYTPSDNNPVVTSGSGLSPSTNLPDLIANVSLCTASSFEFTITNNGTAPTSGSSIEYEISSAGSSSTIVNAYSGGVIAPGDSTASIFEFTVTDCFTDDHTITIDPNDLIIESDETNNSITTPGVF